ncbi:eIF5-mimic protein 2-like [Haliotis asinina]|uniref:eIF5-mimic protein 2-like n=1 Tax=Haliotis asinina TaxID=109174 RepID=UPI003531F0F3
MTTKAEKPTLSGTRLKTRKRDEKEKYDPAAFRDTIIQGLDETEGDLEKVSKFLDISGSRLNYRRYADVLFDILFAGGQLAPGGFVVQDPDPEKPSRTNVCVFSTEENVEKQKSFYEVFYKLIRRYKYLEKAFEDSLKKILVFLKGFSEDERRKLAIITSLLLANGLCTARVLASLFEDHLVKEGLSLEFSTVMFKTWLGERDLSSVFSTLKKSQIDTRLMELFPINKRNQDVFSTYFRNAGLAVIAEMQVKQEAVETKKKLQQEMNDMIREQQPAAEIRAYVLEEMQKNGIPEHEVVILVWIIVMGSVEWNKKDELVTEQALKHLATYAPLLAAVSKSGKSQLALILRIQEYCYENMNFMKSFQKIVVLLYDKEVLSEDVIQKWYKGGHSSKGKSTFLEQMKKFVEWLENAEEESDEDDD